MTGVQTCALPISRIGATLVLHTWGSALTHHPHVYATLGTTRSEFSAQIAAAKTKGDTATVDSTQKKLDAATGLRTTMQTGETLSGLLLTTFGFSVIGSIAQMAANVLYLLAGVMVLLSVAGLVHAYVTPKEKVVFGPVVVRPRIPVQA